VGVAPLLRLADTIDAVNGYIGRGTAQLTLACILASAVTATLRYLADWGSNALIEVQWFLFGLVFLLCAPWTLQQNAHVRVDVLYGRLPARARLGIDILGGLLFLIPVCVLIAYHAWPFFLISFGQGEGSPNPGGLPWWPMKLVIPVAFALLAAQGLAEVIKSVAALTGHRPLPERHRGH
jgi:TRAP-type mannitol/chloroaromatic compound transport system permease small subunit